MSRIGNRILTFPQNVTVVSENGCVTVKGPNKELSLKLDSNIDVKVEGNEIRVTRNSDIKRTKQMHGTTNALIANMIKGVSEGFEKSLEINGVGYRFNVKGKMLEVNAGYSHKVELQIPEDISIDAVSATEIKLKGHDKQALGQFAAKIRKIREPEPYKGKGIKYAGEKIRRKEGKKASK